MRAPKKRKRSIGPLSRAGRRALMAIVSLRDQRITSTNAKGWILRAAGFGERQERERETPAGIMQRIQKVEGPLLEPV